MRGKGKKFVPNGKKFIIAFPGGAGFGCIFERRAAEIPKDLAGGHITAQAAEALCGLAPKQIANVLAQASKGKELEMARPLQSPKAQSYDVIIIGGRHVWQLRRLVAQPRSRF